MAKTFIIIILFLILSGCTTLQFESDKPAHVVSTCIRDGWSAVPDYPIPVTLEKKDGYYFVDVILLRDLPTNIPVHSIWAKVTPKSSNDTGGSATIYRRNMQIMHKKIDSVVEACQ